MTKRPHSYELPFVHYSPRRTGYLEEMVARERDYLLPWANDFGSTPDIYFATDRAVIGHMALPYLTQLRQSTDQPLRVLEIGGGEGKAILYLLDALNQTDSTLPTVFFTMTSLTEQPEQAELKECGVELHIPMIAEKLPPDWSDTFNLVLTCAVLGWAYMDAAIPEIKRVLAPGGYWLGLESFNGSPSYSHDTYPGLIGYAMYANQMVNTLPESERQRRARDEGIYAVEYQKPVLESSKDTN